VEEIPNTRCFMARKPQDERVESIYNKVQENPGEKPGFIARLLR
jgi:hypothetical protein